MAIFHNLHSTIARGGHTCAVATAAYRSGSLLTLKTPNAKTYSFDYSTKLGIAFSAIMAPAHAPVWATERQSLWQHIENTEKEYDAPLAFEVTIALPEELTAEQNTQLLKEFAENSFVKRGLIVDVNLHNDHSNNPHAHLMCPARNLDGKIFDPHQKAELIKAIQQEQAEIINKHLALNGHNVRITHLADPTPRYDQLRPWL